MERSELYGDLLFETMLAEGDQIRHIGLHYNRMKQGALLLKIDFQHNFNQFCNLLTQAIQTYRLTNPEAGELLRVRLTVARTDGGFYLPISNIGVITTQIHPFKPTPQDNPLRLGIYRENVKAATPLSNLKSGNALIYVLASIYAKENQLDDCLILNQHSHIIEATSSNIFWKTEEGWFTPPLQEGCVAGIGRQIFMESYNVIEKICREEDLLTANRCILTNAIYPEREFIPVF